MRRVYLDAATVAPPLPAAREAWLAALDEGWADPRRLHHEGRRARLLLDAARESLADGLGTRPDEIVLTSSHVTAVRDGVLGARAARPSATAVVASAVEHSAVLQSAGEGVRAVGVDGLGRVDVGAFRAALAVPGAVLAALQSANGEVGTLQPVEEVARAARAAGVPLLVDVAASAGRTPTPEGWDLLTADPRAWGAPPGAGVLAVRTGVRWRSPGPEHDGPERVPGAADVPAALAAAVALRTLREAADAPRARALTGTIRSAAAALPDTDVVGDPDRRLPHVVTFSCLYVDGEVLVGELDRAGFAVGSGSACTAASLRPSHVLAAMGVLTHGNVRVGLHPAVQQPEVDAFCAALPGAVARVRALLGADRL